MRIWNSISPEKQKELVTCEENTMYSQAIHYANRMVYLLVPLDVGHKSGGRDIYDDERASNSIANSVAESDSADAESGFEDQDPGETGAAVIRSVSRFIDKVRILINLSQGKHIYGVNSTDKLIRYVVHCRKFS